jgi:hypothetical protein
MESISPALGVVIMMNNYFHDVATGLLVASWVALYFIMKSYDDGGSRQSAEYLLRLYQTMTRVARFSFWWIIIAGFPRTYFYRDFEWAASVDNLQVPAIIVKHVVVFILVVTGVYMWRQFSRKVRKVRQSLVESAGQTVSEG